MSLKPDNIFHTPPIATSEVEYVEVDIDVAIDADGNVCAAGPRDEGNAAQFVREVGGDDDCVQSYTVKLRLPKPRRVEIDLREEPLLPFDPPADGEPAGDAQ